MGCDIHCYIEYKRQGDESWRDFGKRINPGRNYRMFGVLAGVRCDLPHIEPRGVPSDLAYASSDDYWTYITEDGSDDSYCTPDRAESWVKYGAVIRFPEKPLIGNFVSGPDWHTHSWLTGDEFELALASYLKHSGFQIGQLQLAAPASSSEIASQVPALDSDAAYALRSITEYWAILQAMRCFEAQGCESRLVFWFDN